MAFQIWATTVIVPSYTVTIYGASTGTGLSITFEYSLDGGTSWSSVGSSFDSTSCSSRGSFLIVSGNSASIRASDGSNTYTMSRTLNSTTCPGSPYNACAVLVSNVTSDRDVAITVDTNGAVC